MDLIQYRYTESSCRHFSAKLLRSQPRFLVGGKGGGIVGLTDAPPIMHEDKSFSCRFCGDRPVPADWSDAPSDPGAPWSGVGTLAAVRGCGGKHRPGGNCEGARGAERRGFGRKSSGLGGGGGLTHTKRSGRRGGGQRRPAGPGADTPQVGMCSTYRGEEQCAQPFTSTKTAPDPRRSAPQPARSALWESCACRRPVPTLIEAFRIATFPTLDPTRIISTAIRFVFVRFGAQSTRPPPPQVGHRSSPMFDLIDCLSSSPLGLPPGTTSTNSWSGRVQRMIMLSKVYFVLNISHAVLHKIMRVLAKLREK